MTDSPSQDDPELQADIHSKCVNRFIELANVMKDEGLEPGVVSHALMSVSGIYATYAIAGNSNGLNQAGVDKLTEFYRKSLENIQRSKKEQAREA
ncbi:MAG: DUF3144 domain-containing protein [Proteobacteria bacterium]|nr:DUF3144 domain-containing protein [Pseudomonadota bacterium]